eukprot:SAG11_NODE_30251_length_302_cov_1.778325_1_plen_63_part_10
MAKMEAKPRMARVRNRNRSNLREHVSLCITKSTFIFSRHRYVYIQAVRNELKDTYEVCYLLP